ncbi:MAG: DNA translocase FtsK [Thermoactinomyces sp.]
MARKKKNANSEKQLKKEILFEIYGIVILALSFITMASYGAIGRNLTYLARFVVGTWNFVIPLLGIWLAIYVMANRKWPRKWTPRMSGLAMILISFLTLNHYWTFQTIRHDGGIVDTTWNLLLQERNSRLPLDVGGGMIGAFAYALLHFLFDDTGTLIVLSAFVLCGILLVADFSYVKFFNAMKRFYRAQKKRGRQLIIDWLRQYYKQKQQSNGNKRKGIGEKMVSVSQEPIEPVIYDFEDAIYGDNREKEKAEQTKQMELELEKMIPEALKPKSKPKPDKAQNRAPAEEESMEVRFHSKDELANYLMPPTTLLRETKKRGTVDQDDHKENARTLTETLESFGVKAKVIGIHRGPTVTRYEIQPEIGVKVSRIVNLADDIALALAAKDIRIEAPIPGKSAVGIEVPNQEVSLVGLRDILESPDYRDHPSKLSIALGRDIYGKPIVDNLARMPHLLVAGATGSGKSVCINGIITSLLYKARPDEVKLMMIDPKMVELNVYNGIPHLLVPVVTDPRKAAIALKKVVAEMEKRYEMFAKHGARDIERFNQMAAENKEKGVEPLPYIVVIVDELADLMMVAPSDVEDAICRLAQMARAAGIHLIIATQRPSVDVITGVIKANIPSRIAFAVSSQADSRTILDMGGADKLLGRGDMLYLPIGASKPIRVQGAFLSDDEVEAVARFVSKQQQPHYQEEMIPTAPDQGMTGVDDELFPQAVKLVLEAKTASVSLLQRRLRVGYTRAARLIDMMESNGIVGPYEGSKPREVLITLEQYEENKKVAK